MSYLKFSNNLQLEQIELNKLKEFLDDSGFRAFILDNSSSFGFIKHYGESFTNGLVQEDTGLTVKVNPADIIDANGDVITIPALSQLAITADSNWYWIKVAYASSSQETGTYSIDTEGNLICTSSNGSFTTLLRGQPNFPSRIRFLNASYNILEYDVEEIIDDNHATLTGSFTSETGLTLSVVGTFTPGYVASSDEKDIFQYDSYTLSLVLSNTSSEPAHNTGTEFFLARVKNTGSILYIEDKRNDIWTTNTNYYVRHLDTLNNPLIGVEQITFDDQFTPRDKNVMQIAWGFRAVTFNVNLKLNTITVSAGSGGIFKSSNFASVFTDGDFDGWRVYTADGKYYVIQTSSLVSGNIQLNFDNLDGTSFFSDINSVTSISQTLKIVPDAEEVEIICTPDQDLSTDSINQIVEKRKSFPINELYGRIRLIVYDDTNAQYTISYRYKHIRDYGPELTIPDDTTGYYDEDQFNINGDLINVPARTSYSSGIVTLILASSAYVNEIYRLDLGDALGVDTVRLTNSMLPVRQLYVGTDRQYQHYTGDALTLGGDLYINLNKTQVDSLGAACRNGNHFYLHFAQQLIQQSYTVRIVTDYVDTSNYTLIKEFTDNDFTFIEESETGLFIRVTYDGSDWFYTSVNEVSLTTAAAMDTSLFFVSMNSSNPQIMSIKQSSTGIYEDQSEIVYVDKTNNGNFDNGGSNWNTYEYTVPTGGFTGDFVVGSIKVTLLANTLSSGATESLKIKIVKNGATVLAESNVASFADTDTVNTVIYIPSVIASGVTLSAGDKIKVMLESELSSGATGGVTVQFDSGQFSNQD